MKLYTHTHTDSLENNKKINIDKKVIALVILLVTIILLISAGITISNIINKNLSPTIKKEELAEMQFSYRATSYENKKFEIVIKVTDNNGIDTIELPNGNNIKCYGKKQIGIDYQVEDGIDYIFKARNTQGTEKVETVNFIKPKEPKIKDAFTLLTLSGADIPKIEIEYDEREDFENYYSIDDGQTWNLYTEPLDIVSKVKAKSQNKKYPEIYTISEYTTIGINAFDNDETTYETLNTYPSASEFYVEIDNQIIGQWLKFNLSNAYSSANGDGTIINFLDENFEVVQTIKKLSNGGEKFDKAVEIPINSKYLEFSISSYGGPVTIYEIGIVEDYVIMSVSDAWSGDGYSATDGNFSTAWTTNSGNYGPHWLKFQFINPKIVTSYYLYGAYSWGVLYRFYLEASEDGNEWTSLEGDTIHDGILDWSAGEWNISIDNKKAYKYYRIYFPQGGWTYGWSGGCTIVEAKLFW